jgi:hypothetical protein
VPALPAVNNLRTFLTAPMTAMDVVAVVGFTTGFPDAGVFSLEDEAIAYTGRTPTTFTGLTRGFDGTLAVGHAASVVCSLRIIAKHLNDAGFLNAAPMALPVGGIPAGSTFPERLSVQEMLQQLLYGPQTPPAPNGTTMLVRFDSASPTGPFDLPVYDVLVTQALDKIDIEVLEAWDGAGATIEVGILGQPDKYFSSTDTELTYLARFSKEFADIGPNQIIVTVTPGTSPTTGQIRIQVATTPAGT